MDSTDLVNPTGLGHLHEHIMKQSWTILISCGLLAVSSPAVASQEEFFKGLGGGGSTAPVMGGDPTRLLAVIGMALAALLLIAWLIHLRRSAATRVMNHPGKLVREVSKKVGLKPAQIKKLKPLAEQVEVSNPLVLMLCPSLMAQAMKQSQHGKADK